jgi:hypothetical protein
LDPERGPGWKAIARQGWQSSGEKASRKRNEHRKRSAKALPSRNFIVVQHQTAQAPTISLQSPHRSVQELSNQL